MRIFTNLFLIMSRHLINKLTLSSKLNLNNYVGNPLSTFPLKNSIVLIPQPLKNSLMKCRVYKVTYRISPLSIWIVMLNPHIINVHRHF